MEPTLSPAPSVLQAVIALAVVILLILAITYVMKRFAFGQGPGGLSLGVKRPEKRLKIVETLILDARYRVIAINDHGVRRTLLLGPQEAIQLGKSRPDDFKDKPLQPGESPTGSAHAPSLKTSPAQNGKPATPTLHAER